jgi:hypothetical protein
MPVNVVATPTYTTLRDTIIKRPRRDLTKVREMRCAAWSEQSIEQLADRLYASDAGLDWDFDGGEPTVIA